MVNKLILWLVALVISLYNCHSNPLTGVIYSNTRQHVYGDRGENFNSGRLLKSGESCSVSSLVYFINILYYGDGNSIQEAKIKGGIQKIVLIDYSSTSLFMGVFYQSCIIVWGE